MNLNLARNYYTINTVIKMNINKFHYKQLTEPCRIYLDETTLEIRQRLNMAFKTPINDEDETTGIYGKYYKSEKLYKIKYIYARNRQLQPMLYERYYYLLEIGEDSKGAYVEYVMVYDKLYDPFIRIVYILAVIGIILYLYKAYITGVMMSFSAIALSVIALLSTMLVFKKSKESQQECSKGEKTLKSLIKS